MHVSYELTRELQRCLGVCSITIKAGTRLVSRDGGNTYRFEGMNALTVLTAQEISALLLDGVVREVSR